MNIYMNMYIYKGPASAPPAPAAWPSLPAPNPRYRGPSIIRNSPLVGPYSRTIPRVLWWFWGGGCFLCARYLWRERKGERERGVCVSGASGDWLE